MHHSHVIMEDYRLILKRVGWVLICVGLVDMVMGRPRAHHAINRSGKNVEFSRAGLRPAG